MTDTKWLDVDPIRERHKNAVTALEKFLDGDFGHHMVSASVWRVVQSDSENMDAIAPWCGDLRHREFGDDDGRVRECCDVGLAIETPHEKVAAFLAAVFVDVPVLAAEVERVTRERDQALAEVDRLRAEVANTQPSTLAETLRDAIRALDIYTCEEADRIAAPVIKEAQEAATAIKAWREAEVEQERQRSAALVAETRREIEVQERHVDRAKAETTQSRAAIERVKHVQVWTNEDGKRFVFADDLTAALSAETAIEWQYGVRIHYVDDGPMDLAWSTEHKARAQLADLAAEGSRADLIRRHEGGEWEVVDAKDGVS